MVSHLFHQVERKLDEWLNLASALLAQMVQNATVVTMPKSAACQFKHLELISLQGSVALVILVISGARLRQQLITLDQVISQAQLTAIANKLNAAYSGLTGSQVLAKESGLPTTERQIADYAVKVMESEDNQEYEASYLDGLHWVLNQPEFAHHHRMMLTLL